jgi:hypothetical protein
MPDNQIIGKDGRTKEISESERKPGSLRNKTREAEYDDLGIPNNTYGVGKGKGKGKSDNVPNNQPSPPD